MSIFTSTKELESTPFSDFFRNASSSEKTRVYARVLKGATIRQQEQLARVKAAKDNNIKPDTVEK